MKLLKPILSTLIFILISFLGPLFFEWYSSILKEDTVPVSAFMCAFFLFLASIGLQIHLWVNYFENNDNNKTTVPDHH